MCTRLRPFLPLVGLLCFGGISAADAATACKVVNLMPAFWRSLERSDAAAQIRAALIVPHPDLYNENYVSLPSGAKWDAVVARERTYVGAHRKEVTAAEGYLSAQAQPLMTQFQQMFTDYKCDFTFYIAPSFGQMDGSAAFVNGQHRIIFAPDVIPRYHQLSELKVLVDHETFHIYHHQATGVYGASAEAVPTILEALWGEGLATFVSWRMNPDVSLDTALLQPGIPEAAKPHLADIAKDLLAHLDDKDEPTYLHYFVAGRQPQDYPPRAGYFVGALIAQDLSTRYTLPQLAHLNGPELHASVTETLQGFAAARADPESPVTGLESVATPAAASAGDDPGHRLPNQSADTSLPASLTKQVITFNSHDLMLVGFLFKPEGRGPFPAIIWNHGSEKDPDRGPQFDTVAKVFVPAGYVVFAPVRRGHGESQGTYMVAVVDSIRRTRGADAANQQSVHLMESEQLDDQLAGLAYLETLPYVDSSRLVVAGCSFGGIETLLAAERDVRYKAAIAISPGALSWQHNPALQRRLVRAVRNINIPVLLLQPAKDASLEPSRVLGEEFRRLGKPFSGKIYPAVGPEDEQRHCFGGAKGMHVWGQDALEFVSRALR